MISGTLNISREIPFATGEQMDLFFIITNLSTSFTTLKVKLSEGSFSLAADEAIAHDRNLFVCVWGLMDSYTQVEVAVMTA